MISWYEASKIIRKEYGTQVKYGSDNFWICPECGEPILEEDYPELETGIEDGNTYFVCPVCEEHL